MFQLDALVIFRVKVHEARCQNMYLFIAMQVARDTYSIFLKLHFPHVHVHV